MKRFLLAVKNPLSFLSEKTNRSSGFIHSLLDYFFSKKVYRLALAGILLLATGFVHAQTSQSDYLKTITERSAKIVNTLDIKDSSTYYKVVDILVHQYHSLNDLQEKNKSSVEAIRQKGLSKEETEEQLKKLDEQKTATISGLHKLFVAQLHQNLNEEQVEKVKDGMTYRILPITYAAYLDEIPTLTNEQKAQIYAWLKEARELAIDAESSEKKHAVFGKYKGRINNYLSAAGYDMKKEGEEWQKRIKARTAEKKDSRP